MCLSDYSHPGFFHFHFVVLSLFPPKNSDMRILLFALLVFNLGCSQNSKSQENPNMGIFSEPTQAYQPEPFEWQGHRGARGLFPENSLIGFLMALKQGVRVLEMDVVVSKDGKIVLSHEPWISSKIGLKPDGKRISQDEEMSYNIYKMYYEEVKKYDCGSVGHPDFPEQKAAKSLKPLLSQVVQSVNSMMTNEKIESVKYNIELKSKPEWYGVYVPQPSEFVRLILAELKNLGIENQASLQSFDVNILEEIKKQSPETKVAYLVENTEDLEINLKKLSFKPEVYSPNHKLVNEALLNAAHSKNIRVITWTVNDTADMKRLIEMGVDGIITDYPNRITH